MKRLYLESFIALVLLFFVSLQGFDFFISNFREDSDFLLEQKQLQSTLSILRHIRGHDSQAAAEEALAVYAEENFLLLHRITPDELPPEVREQLAADHDFVDGDPGGVHWFYLGDQLFELEVDEEAPVRLERDRDNLYFFPFLFTGFALYSILLIWLLTRRMRSLTQASRAFAAGDLTARAAEGSGRSLGTLNADFNLMAEKISSLLTSNRTLTNAVAHELRTPIFKMQWQAELLAEGELTEKQHKAVESIITDSEEMEALVDELLRYSRLEQDGGELQLQPLVLGDWLVRQQPRWLQETGREIELVVPGGAVRAAVDEKLLTRALDNLVRNAGRFAAENIRLSLAVAGGEVQLRVEDDGCGIAEEEFQRIFEPFYTSDKARNKGRSGYGLGLSIVRQIVRRHGGEVSAGRSDLGGALFVVRFPVGE